MSLLMHWPVPSYSSIRILNVDLAIQTTVSNRDRIIIRDIKHMSSASAEVSSASVFDSRLSSSYEIKLLISAS